MVHYLAKEALLAHGLVKLATRLQLLLQTTQVAGLALVLPFGLIGACWGILIATVLGLGLAQWHLALGCGFTVQQLWAACQKSLQVTALALLPAAVLFVVLPATEDNHIRHILLSGGLTVLAWTLALRWVQHPLWHEVVHAAGPAMRRLAAR